MMEFYVPYSMFHKALAIIQNQGENSKSGQEYSEQFMLSFAIIPCKFVAVSC